MRTLEEIKEHIAHETGYDAIEGCSAWQNLLNEVQGDTDLIDHYVGCVAFMYAEEVLKEAADKALVVYEQNFGGYTQTGESYCSEDGITIVDKQSVLSIIDRLN